MLTVDFDRLGLVRGERVLDLGSGGGRHAFEAMRRGARVTALDYSAPDLKDVAAVAGAMIGSGEATYEQWAGAVNADGTVTYQAAANTSATVSFTYTVCDTKSTCANGVVTVTCSR